MHYILISTPIVLACSLFLYSYFECAYETWYYRLQLVHSDIQNI